jgi:hypothetical protein
MSGKKRDGIGKVQSREAPFNRLPRGMALMEGMGVRK